MGFFLPYTQIYDSISDNHLDLSQASNKSSVTESVNPKILG